MNVQTPLWTKKKCAEFLDMSVRNLERHIRAREIRVIRIGRSVRIDPVEIHSFVVRHSTKLAPLELKSHFASYDTDNTGDRA